MSYGIIENVLNQAFDLHRFAPNARLQAVIDRTHARMAARELSDDELDNVAGGGRNEKTTGEAAYSLASLGIFCAINAIISAADGHVGQQTEEEGRLCN